MRARPLIALAFVLLLVPGAHAADAEEPWDAVPWARGESRAEDLEFVIVTVGPGRESAFARFGHSGLIVADRFHDTSRFYNYGVYTFNESFATARVATGHATFHVNASDTEWVLGVYKKLDRDVRFQRLDLPLDARLALAERVARDTMPEHRAYAYHPYLDNCATRLRDALDEATGGALRAAVADAPPATARALVLPYLADAPLALHALHFFSNADTDVPLSAWDGLFLPVSLERAVANASVEHADGTVRPLASEAWPFHVAAAPAPAPRAPTTWPLVLAGAVVAAGAVGAGAWARRDARGRAAFLGVSALVAVAVGVPGLALTFAWAVDGHGFGWPNANVLVANALTFLAFPLSLLAFTGRPRALVALSRTWQALAVLGGVAVAWYVTPWSVQENAAHLAALVPVNAALALGATWAQRTHTVSGTGDVSPE